jgi:sec-independent protein translocase protein TatA
MTALLLAFLEGPELIIILVIILVLFGGSQLPRLARSLGEAKREFEKGMSHDEKSAANSKSDSSSTDEKKSSSTD